MNFDLGVRALQICRERGLDPADAPDPQPFDPIAWRLERTHATLDDLLPAQFRRASADHPAVTAWTADHMAGVNALPSLFIAGPTGCGKTYQALGALRMIAIDSARCGRTLDWRYATHAVFADRTRPKPDNSHVWAAEPYIHAGFLVFDDLGTTKGSDWTIDVLYRLIDYRWTNRLPTIWTTNLNAADLASVVGERILSRLLDAPRIAIAGPDRRRAPGGQR